MPEPIRALLAKALDGELHVLATDSIDLANDCEAVSTADLDLGLGLLDPKDKPEGPGLFLWTGTSKVGWDGVEVCVAYDGTCRPVVLDELMELLAMAPPEPPDLPPYEE
jgi:hypothetical protein